MMKKDWITVYGGNHNSLKISKAAFEIHFHRVDGGDLYLYENEVYEQVARDVLMCVEHSPR